MLQLRRPRLVGGERIVEKLRSECNLDQNLPIMEAPWSRAAPVRLCTRCSRLSRDLAGLDGALVPRWGPLPKLSDSSGPPVGGADPGTGPGDTADPAVPGAGGGGMLGGPPGIGCCCRGG